MRRIQISPNELKRIIELRQLGDKWTEIERETKVERRVAKRAYEEWERDKRIEEEKAARFRVRAQALNEHVNDLVSLARSISNELGISHELDAMGEDADQFLSRLLQKDLLSRYGSPRSLGTQEHDYVGFYYREKELLFESLKTHGGKELRGVLEHDWLGAKNNCAGIIAQLRKDTNGLVGRSFSQTPPEDLLERCKEASRQSGLLEQLTDGVLRAVCRAIVQGKLDQDGKDPRFIAEERLAPAPGDMDTDVISAIGSETHETVVRFFGSTNKRLAEETASICDRVVSELRKADNVEALGVEVGNLREAQEELLGILNQVRLKPMILNTRCDLCPV